MRRVTNGARRSAECEEKFMAQPSLTGPSGDGEKRNPMQRRADSALADYPYRLELRGSLGEVAWPPVCANCGAPASERLPIRKVFTRPRIHGRRRFGSVRYALTTAHIPFCAGCAERHRQLAPPPRGFARQALGALLTPWLIPIAGTAVLGVIALRRVLEMPPADPTARLAWALPALLLLMCLRFVVGAWRTTLPDRIEPPSEVTRAFDFSDDVSWPLEGERRIYAMRNVAFAESFAAANRARAWAPGDYRLETPDGAVIVKNTAKAKATSRRA